VHGLSKWARLFLSSLLGSWDVESCRCIYVGACVELVPFVHCVLLLINLLFGVFVWRRVNLLFRFGLIMGERTAFNSRVSFTNKNDILRWRALFSDLLLLRHDSSALDFNLNLPNMLWRLFNKRSGADRVYPFAWANVHTDFGVLKLAVDSLDKHNV
jgi:hypothetical protein